MAAINTLYALILRAKVAHDAFMMKHLKVFAIIVFILSLVVFGILGYVAGSALFYHAPWVR